MDLTTTYLGLTLRNPVVASASPMTQDVDGVRRLVDAGVSAVVLPSLFEEQVRREEVSDTMLQEVHEGSFGEARTYFPDSPTTSLGGVRAHLSLVERAVQASEVPVIASLNGSSRGGWTEIATALAGAGAAAIELNIYAVPGDTYTSGAEVEKRHLDIVASVCSAVSVPVSVKLSPFFSATGALAQAIVNAGAQGLVLFNRFVQPDIDPVRIAVVPNVHLSSRTESRVPMTWIAILRNQIRTSFAGTTGVEEPEDVAAYLLAGADVVMTASALLRHGPQHATHLVTGLEGWLAEHGYDSVNSVKGLLSVGRHQDAEGYERTGYVAALRKARETYGSLT